MSLAERQPLLCKLAGFRLGDEIFTHRFRCVILVVANIIHGAASGRFVPELIPDSIRDGLAEQREGR